MSPVVVPVEDRLPRPRNGVSLPAHAVPGMLRQTCEGYHRLYPAEANVTYTLRDAPRCILPRGCRNQGHRKNVGRQPATKFPMLLAR